MIVTSSGNFAFDEYKCNDFGIPIFVVKYKIWYMWPNFNSLESIGKACNIPEDELLMLKLKYG